MLQPFITEAVAFTDAFAEPHEHFAVQSTMQFLLPADPQPQGEAAEEYWHLLDLARGNDRAPSLAPVDARDFSSYERLAAGLAVVDVEADYESPVVGSGRDEKHRAELDTTDVVPRDPDDGFALDLEKLGVLWNEDAAHHARQLRAEARFVVPIGVGPLADAAHAAFAELPGVELVEDDLGQPALALSGPGAGVAATLLADPWLDDPTVARAARVMARPERGPQPVRRRPLVADPVARTARFAARCAATRRRVEEAFPTPLNPEYVAWHERLTAAEEAIEDREARGFTLSEWRKPGPDESDAVAIACLRAGYELVPRFARTPLAPGARRTRVVTILQDGVPVRRESDSLLRPFLGEQLPKRKVPAFERLLRGALALLEPRREAVTFVHGPQPQRRVHVEVEFSSSEYRHPDREVRNGVFALSFALKRRGWLSVSDEQAERLRLDAIDHLASRLAVVGL